MISQENKGEGEEPGDGELEYTMLLSHEQPRGKELAWGMEHCAREKQD